MKCPKCGAELAPNSLRCKKCEKTHDILHRLPEQYAHKQSDVVSQQKMPIGSNEDISQRDTELPTVSYIICPPFQPIELHQGQKLTIGRDESSHLLLSSWEVSRFHAVIEWEAGIFIIRDMDSANGTFVNDDYIESHKLRDADEIYVGTHTLVYREVPKGTAPYLSNPDVALRDTLRIQMSKGISDKLRAQASQNTFGGNIQSIGLFPILQMLGIDFKSGCLKIIKDSGDTGRVYLLQGDVVHCVYGDLQGTKAFFEILKQKRGRFEFIAGNPAELKMREKIEWLLIEGARMIDEEEENV